MGENISIAPAFRTKSPHRGVILLRAVEGVGPYNSANDNLKQLDKPELKRLIIEKDPPGGVRADIYGS